MYVVVVQNINLPIQAPSPPIQWLVRSIDRSGPTIWCALLGSNRDHKQNGRLGLPRPSIHYSACNHRDGGTLSRVFNNRSTSGTSFSLWYSCSQGRLFRVLEATHLSTYTRTHVHLCTHLPSSLWPAKGNCCMQVCVSHPSMLKTDSL